MWETRVQSLGQEGPLEKEMATHSTILAWRIPWTKEPGGLQSVGSQDLDMKSSLGASVIFKCFRGPEAKKFDSHNFKSMNF